MSSPNSESRPRLVPDHVIVRTLWPVLLAAVIGLFPFTVYSTFLVPISEASGQDVAVVGALRGVGGIAAVAVGVAIAPLLARWSAPHTTAFSLALLSATSLVATVGTLPALISFCVGIGAATAILTPALLRIAVATYTARGDAGRAATLVTATQSLAAVLAAPVIGAIALWEGWRGALWVTAGVAAVIAFGFLRPKREPAAVDTAPLPYFESFRQLRRRPDLLAMIGIAFLRTTSFMGYLALLAASYHDRFGLDPASFTLVWTLSGASFFAGNYLAGRWVRRGRLLLPLLFAGLAGAAVAVVVVFTTASLPVALGATAVMGFSHAIVAAVVTTMITDRAGALTAPTYSMNAAGMSLGVFVGALIASVGISLGGGLGIGIALLVPTLVAVALVPAAVRGGA